jgi:hypothetical protein
VLFEINKDQVVFVYSVLNPEIQASEEWDNWDYGAEEEAVQENN